MRWALVGLVLAGCGSSVDVGSGGAGGAGAGAGNGGAGGACPGSPPLCADDCGSDYFPENADCVGGAWVCPPGTVNPDDCPPGTCWGPPLQCEVCGPSGWECQPTPECTAGCGGLVCAVCPPGGGTYYVGACACECDSVGQFGCMLAAGCCEVDLDCGDLQYVPCVNNVCKQPVPDKCWSDAECADGAVCVGASVCPCNTDCDMEDQPGDCVPAP
jgi:hypothetical protein